jgi:hypothetical protein
MTVRGFTHHAKRRHGRGRLDDDNPVKDEVPKCERASQLDWCSRAYSARSLQLIPNLVS